MVKERFTMYLLGSRVESSIEGDIYFQGVGYGLERRINGLIIPSTVQLSPLDIRLDPEKVYGRVSSLTSEQVSFLKSLIENAMSLNSEREYFIKTIKKDREIRDGIFMGVQKNIDRKGFREELLTRLRREGKFVYASAGKELTVNGGPIPNGGAQSNFTGKVMAIGRNSE